MINFNIGVKGFMDKTHLHEVGEDTVHIGVSLETDVDRTYFEHADLREGFLNMWMPRFKAALEDMLKQQVEKVGKIVETQE